MSDARDDTQWFQLLLRNKAIRNYLTSFRAKEWPEVLKLTTLYGIISLHKQHGGPLPAAQLRDAIAKGSMAITAEASLPGLQLQLDQLQGQLEEITDDIYAPSVDKPSKARGSREGASQGPSLLQVSYNGQGPQGLSPTIHSEGLPGGQAPSVHFAASPLRQRASEELRYRSRSVEPGREGRSRHQPVKAPLPSAQWRAGDTARVWSPPGRKRSPGRAMSPAKEPAPDSAVYPAWWGDGSDQAKSQGPVPSKAAPLGRPPPRMACTVRPELVPLHVDDLVSSKYLDVASSGYGVAAPPRATSDTRQQAGPQQQQGTWADQGTTLQHWLPAAGTDPLSSPWGDQLPQLTAGQSLESGWGLAGAQTLFAMHPSGTMVPVVLPQPTLAPPLHPPPQQQPQQPPADENQGRGHAGAGDLGKGTQGRGGRKKLDLGIVESRIKQQVAADRAAARGKSQARQQALQQALGGGAPGPQANLPHAPSWAAQAPAALATPTHSHPASRSLLKGPSSVTPTSASEMAANLAASPWASWFMDNSDGHPPEAGVVHLPHERGLASDTQPSHMADAALNQAAWWPEAAQAPGGRQQDHQQQPQPQLPMWLDIPASTMQQQQQPGRPHEPRRQAEPQADQLAQQLQGVGLGGQHQALAWEVPVSELRRPSTASQPPSREGRGAGKGARQPGEPRAYAGVRPEVAQLARGWVGDFGKLQPQPQGAQVTESSCPEPRNIPSPMLGLVGRRQPQPDDDPEAAALRAEVYALRSRLQQLAKQGGGLEHLAPTVAEMRANLLALNTATRGAGSLEPLTDALAASRSVDGMRSAPQGLSRANSAMPPGMAGDERAIALARSLIAAAAERAASAGEVQAGPSTREQPALARSDGQQASGSPATSGAPMSSAGAAAPNDVSNVLGARAGSPTVAHLPSHGMGASRHSTYEGIDYDYIESEYSTASAGSSGHDVAANDRRIAWGECGEEHARQNSAWQLEAAEQLQRLLRHQLQLAREEDERLQQQEQALALPEPSPTPSDPPAVLAEELLAPQHGAHQSNSPQPSHMLPGITRASTKQAVRLSILGQAPELVQGRLDHQDHQDHEKQFVPELPEAGRFAAPTRAAGPSGDHYNSLLGRAQPDPAGTVVQTSGLGHEAPTRATSRSSWMSVEPASRGQLAFPPSSFCSSSSQGSSVSGAAGVAQDGNTDSHTPAEPAAVPPQPPTPPIPPPPSTALVPAKDDVPGTSASGLTITPGAPTREVGPPACTPALPPLAAVTAPPNPHMAPAAPASSTASLLHNRLNHPALRTSASSFTSFGSGSSLGDEELLQQSILQLTNMLSDSDSDLDLSAWAAWAPTSHALTAALHRASQGAVPPPPATLPPSDPASTPTSHHTSVTSATLARNAATKSAGGEGWAGDQDRGKLGEEGGQRPGRLGQADSQAGSSAASFSAAQSPPSQITTTTITTVSRILATLPHNDWGTAAAQVAGSQECSFPSASLGATISLGTDEISGGKPTIQTQMPQTGATVHEARQQVLPSTFLANAGDAAPARRPRVHATLHDAVDPAHVSAGLVGAVTLRGLGTSFLAAAGQVKAVSPRSGLHSSTELSLSDQTRASSSAIWQQRAGGAAGLGSSSLSSLSLSSGLSGVPGGGGVQWGQPGSQQPLQQQPGTSWTLHGLGAAIAGQAASHDLPFHHQSMADAVVNLAGALAGHDPVKGPAAAAATLEQTLAHWQA